MTRFKKGRIVGLASVAVLLTGVVGIGTHSAGAAVSDDFALVTSVGYLSLEIRDSGTRVVQYNVAGTEVDTETVTVTNKCEVTSPGRLLAFTSSTGKVGQVNAGFGTKTKNNCATDEGRVGIAPESIVVTLGSKFAADISIDRSELDIEGKFSASLSWSTNATPGTSGVALLNTTSDNGPDSGAADNNRVGIGTAGSFVDNYRALTLRAIGGSSEIALDGGGDGTYPPAQANSKGSFNSIFLLVSTSFYDYTVPCSTSVLPDAGDNTSDSAGADSFVSELIYVRLPNKNQVDCANVGLNLEATDGSTPDEVYIDNSPTSITGVPQNVRARVKIVWQVNIAGKTQAQIDTELAREIQFSSTSPKVPVTNCTSVPADVTADPLNPFSTAVIGHPGGVAWCLLSDSRVTTGNVITQTQYYSGGGDPRIS